MKAKSCSSTNSALRAIRPAAAALSVALTLSPAMRAGAQPAPPASSLQPSAEEPQGPTRGMEERVSLDLRSTDAADALKYLATKGGLNLALSKNVAGRVNLFLTDVPIRDVFDIILRTNELAYDKQGDVYNVMTEAEYRALYGKKFSDLREVKTFRLHYAIPQQAFNLLDTLKSEIGRLLVDEDSGTVLVMDTPENLREMESALAALEQGGTIRTFDIKYAKAKDVEEQLKEQIEVPKLGTVKADERSNQVVVKTLPDRMKDVERLIQSLDRKTREVLIDSKIVKVALTNSDNTGVDWDKVFSNLKFHGIDTQHAFRVDPSKIGTPPAEVPLVSNIKIPELTTSRSIGKSTKGGELVFGTVARDGYELFRFLETLGQTKIISNPRLMVTENQEARIHVGTREAYVTTTTTSGQTTSTTAEEVQFIDVGIQLVVTPTNINEDGFITMKVKPEVSSVVRTLKTPSNNEIPIVDTSTAETNVLVKNGSTIVLGGLRKEEKKLDNDYLPGLGHLPVIGDIFFNKKKIDSETTELVVFITPHIVSGDMLVTGDEPAFGGGLKAYRDYQPLLSGTAPSDGQTPATHE